MELDKDVRSRFLHFFNRKGQVYVWFKRYLTYFFFVIPAVFYFLTACRNPGWLDATLIVSNVYHFVLGSWVNYHNLFHVLGYGWLKLFPSTNIHYYLLLLSTFLGALTVYLIFLVGIELTSHKLASAIGALVLMISHSLWWHSTMLEVYTLNSAIIAAILLCMVRYNKTERIINLYLAVFFFGLGCSNHLYMGLFVFAFLFVLGALFYKGKILTLRKTVILVFCFLIGFSLYLSLFIRDYRIDLRRARSRESTQLTTDVRIEAFKTTFNDATGGEVKEHMFPEDMSPEVKRFWRFNYIFWLVYNFPSAAFFLGIFGFYCFWKKKVYRLTFIFFLVGLAAQIMFSSNYLIPDMFAFSLPVYILFSIPLIMAIDFLIERGKAARVVLLCLLPTFIAPPFIYTAIPDWSKKPGVVQNYVRNYPEVKQVENTWDPVEYILNPVKRNYTNVSEYADRIFTLLPQDAHFWNSDAHSDYPLRYYYQDIYRIRTDLNYHFLFSFYIASEKLQGEASYMRTCIETGKPVYVVAVEHPIRRVLNQLYLLYHPDDSLDRVSDLTSDEFIRSFQELEFERVDLFEEEQLYIYRVRKIDSL